MAALLSLWQCAMEDINLNLKGYKIHLDIKTIPELSTRAIHSKICCLQIEI